MFLLVGVDDGFFRLVGPRIFPSNRELVAIIDHFNGTERTVSTFGHVVEATGDLPVLNEHA